MYEDKTFGYVLWREPEGAYLYNDGLYLHCKDGTQVLGMIYCPDCLPVGSLSRHIWARIRYDYGFKKSAYCCVCEKLICGVWSAYRQIFVADRTELNQPYML